MSRWSRALAGRRREVVLAGATLVPLALAAVLARGFFAPAHVRDLAVGAALLALPALGLAVVLRAGEIDLSLGGQVAAGTALAAGLAAAGGPFPIAFIAVVTLTCLVGAVNAALVAHLRVPAPLGTLAVGLVLREAARWLAPADTAGPQVGFRFVRESPWLAGAIVVGGAIALVLTAERSGDRIAAHVGRAARGKRAPAGKAARGKDASPATRAFVLAGALAGASACFSAAGTPDVTARATAGFDLDLLATALLAGALAPRATRLHARVATLLAATALGACEALLRFLGAPSAWVPLMEGAIVLGAACLSAPSPWARTVREQGA